MKVYEKIAAVTAEMSKIGISKDRKNQQQGYNFRGIDDVYAALSPLLAKHGLCVLPRVVDRTVSEQQSKNGGVLFYTALRVEFDFVAAEDASKHTVCTIGEAMDSGDKSSNKAMSAAYKYACFQAFCIPTEGDNDADAHTHEVVARAPAGYERWRADMEAVADTGTDALRAAWERSDVALRKWATDHDTSDWWAKAKDRAAKAKVAA